MSIKGAVRPIISLAMAGALIWGFVVGKISDILFLVTADVAIGYWFYQRTKEKNGTTPVIPSQ